MIDVLYFALGAVAGVAQSMLLSRSARRGPNPLSVLVRLVAVAAVLVFAAVAGHLLVAAAGWLGAFLVTGAMLLWRWS